MTFLKIIRYSNPRNGKINSLIPNYFKTNNLSSKIPILPSTGNCKLRLCTAPKLQIIKHAVKILNLKFAQYYMRLVTNFYSYLSTKKK